MISIRNFHFYDSGNNFIGSIGGLRFAIMQKKSDEGKTFEVTVWPEPWSLEKTPDEKKKYASYEFSPDGLEQAKKFIEDEYARNIDYYSSLKNMGFSEMLANRKKD